MFYERTTMMTLKEWKDTFSKRCMVNDFIEEGVKQFENMINDPNLDFQNLPENVMPYNGSCEKGKEFICIEFDRINILPWDDIIITRDMINLWLITHKDRKTEQKAYLDCIDEIVVNSDTGTNDFSATFDISRL